MESDNAENTENLIKPDVIVVWGRNCDYPLWREFIRNERQRFGKVIIAFMETYLGDDYRDFIMQAMAPDDIVFIAPTTQKELGATDWRHDAIQKALKHVNSDWVWFTEQDFLPTDEDFWATVYALTKEADAVGVKEGDRLHPCCLFFEREALERTNKSFGIVPGESDHFGQIQKDIQTHDIKLAIIPGHYKHIAGVSQNFRLISEGQLPNYKPEEFEDYLTKSLKVEVPIDPRFIRTVNGHFRKVAGINL